MTGSILHNIGQKNLKLKLKKKTINLKSQKLFGQPFWPFRAAPHPRCSFSWYFRLIVELCAKSPHDLRIFGKDENSIALGKILHIVQVKVTNLEQWRDLLFIFIFALIMAVNEGKEWVEAELSYQLKPVRNGISYLSLRSGIEARLEMDRFWLSGTNCSFSYSGK